MLRLTEATSSMSYNRIMCTRGRVDAPWQDCIRQKKRTAFATMTAERRRNGMIELIIRSQKWACWYYFEVVLIGGSFIFQRISRLVYFYHVANGIGSNRSYRLINLGFTRSDFFFVTTSWWSLLSRIRQTREKWLNFLRCHRIGTAVSIYFH